MDAYGALWAEHMYKTNYTWRTTDGFIYRGWIESLISQTSFSYWRFDEGQRSMCCLISFSSHKSGCHLSPVCLNSKMCVWCSSQRKWWTDLPCFGVYTRQGEAAAQTLADSKLLAAVQEPQFSEATHTDPQRIISWHHVFLYIWCRI